MRLFDTHCHFETCERAVIDATLARARAAGVEKLMAVGGSEALNASAALASPIHALGYDRDQIDKELPALGEATAIGEIGLDYHYSPETREKQLALFYEELELARARDLPVVIHTREADEDTIALLRKVPSRGIIHSYTGTVEAAKQFLDLGFYVSISGIVTFKAAENVREVARVIPMDRILIETDSPYLAPVPKRGEANEPAFLVHTCRFLAELKGVPMEEFAETTFINAERVLGL